MRINETVPDFEANTSQGPIKFHDWIGGGWAVLFSHPKDFTPVCTTELSLVAKMKPEFDKRNTKVIGLSVDTVDNHQKWAEDIAELAGTPLNFPLIGDPELKVAKQELLKKLRSHAPLTVDGGVVNAHLPSHFADASA